jgi:ankyrin repeat protein
VANKSLSELVQQQSIDPKDGTGSTVLDYAAISGHLEVVKVLLDVHGDLVPLKAKYGRGALEFAELRGYDEICVLLSNSCSC